MNIEKAFEIELPPNPDGYVLLRHQELIKYAKTYLDHKNYNPNCKCKGCEWGKEQIRCYPTLPAASM